LLKKKQTSLKRKSIRLKKYDYSQNNAYFLTICTKNRQPFLGKVINSHIKLTEMGKTVKSFWLKIPEHFDNLELDEFTVMPNHLHGIIIIIRNSETAVGVRNFEPLPQRNKYQHIIPKSISSIVLSYKASVKRWCNKNNFHEFNWQRNYFERVIRNERELIAVRDYIRNNPTNWRKDEYFNG